MSLRERVVTEGSAVDADVFESRYAAMVGTTVEKLHEKGRVAERCSCDWCSCQGWVLSYRI